MTSWRIRMLRDFMKQIADLLPRKEVIRMTHYPGHRMYHRSAMQGRTGALYSKKLRLNHCLRVAYLSYTFAHILGLDKRTAARAGLLHDCGFDPASRDSRVAQILRHAARGAMLSRQLGEASEVSRAIYSHMFPLNPRSPPATGASMILWLADKIDAVLETFSFSTALDKILNQSIMTMRIA